MKKVCLSSWIFIIAVTNIYAQPIVDKLKFAVSALEKDQQLKHGILSFYVMDAKTGRAVFEKNSQIGLAPASTQKIITSVSAFEFLGHGYQFKTYLSYDGKLGDQQIDGNLTIVGNGDPTLGSWRWNSTKEEAVLNGIKAMLDKKSIKRVIGDVIIDDVSYTFQPIPEGWIWQDIGNYYGAGCWSFNWRENQYDLVLQSGKDPGDSTIIVKTVPVLYNFSLSNFITAGKKNSGDNGYIFTAPFAASGFTTGTVPPGERSFTISGSMSYPSLQFSKELEKKLKDNNILVSGEVKLYSPLFMSGEKIRKMNLKLDSISSPTLDSMNFWFMRKSINLYGEAFVKAIAFQKEQKSATTGKGIDIIKDFWSFRGIEKSAMNIIDGSGLSPQNRVTTNTLVKVLQYAKSRPWFNSFYLSIPTFNGMKIKSGTIGGAKSFAGYHTSATGREYIFAIIVNNYDGSSGEIVKKMYKVLDVLK